MCWEYNTYSLVEYRYLKETGGCADLVQMAKKKDEFHEDAYVSQIPNNKMHSKAIFFYYWRRSHLLYCLKESNFELNENTIEETIMQLEEIINPRYDNLLRIHKLNTEKNGLDLQAVILEAAPNGNYKIHFSW